MECDICGEFMKADLNIGGLLHYQTVSVIEAPHGTVVHGHAQCVENMVLWNRLKQLESLVGRLGEEISNARGER